MNIEEHITDMESAIFAEIALLNRFPKINALVKRQKLDWAKACRIARIIDDYRARQTGDRR